MERHIINLEHSSVSFRIYLNWDGEGDGTSELKDVLKKIESEIGPTAKGPTDFINKARSAFSEKGFQLIKK